ncbi:MAG: alkaline phosphatase family protein [Lentisphaeraceae bacterium]|nr:alkaline phosphatase family protein [Lentisphaeraceae bacterium]
MKKLLLINAVGLAEELISEKTPNLKHYYDQNNQYLKPPCPAVTCTSQATLMTGKTPQEHGIVANGWYFRDLAQVWLWRQTNQLIHGDKFWDKIKKEKPDFKTAKMFWWYNMYSSADMSVTPRPIYRSDGSKYPGSYSHPASLNDDLEKEIGKFPLFDFWGPMTSIKSTQWIADSSIHVMNKDNPDLCLVYLPHLDYNLQRVGPNHPSIETDMIELDGVIGDLRKCAEKNDYDVMILSEYGIMEVDKPIHINRALRKNGFIEVRMEVGEEHFDAGASKAFAVADHQLAHVYVQNPADIAKVVKVLEKLDGIDEVLVGDEREKVQLNHPRSGEIVCLAKKNAWFTYYYWLNDQLAPDYARCVDIHQKPGYDPVELFMIPGGKPKAAWTVLKKKLGFRYLLDVIPLDANLVKGSHGVMTEKECQGPLLISNIKLENSEQTLPMENFSSLVENYFLRDS